MSYTTDKNYLDFLESKEYKTYIEDIQTYKLDSFYRAFLQSKEIEDYRREMMFYRMNYD